MRQEWMLRDLLKSQGKIYVPEEDLQKALKEDGATYSSIETGGIAYNKEEIEEDNSNTNPIDL